MSAYSATYFENQAQLTAWTDELEFLGYILCELIDREAFNRRGYQYHQAADLPTIVEILRLQLKRPNGCFSEMMSDGELKTFGQLLLKSKQIRNLMAHHLTRDHTRLNQLAQTKDTLSETLEATIRRAALHRGIHQIAWSPYYHVCKAYMQARGPLTVMIPLNEERLLSFRDRILHDPDLEQERVFRRRLKRKATEESRRKQKEDFETALVRKQQRKERDIAMRAKHQSEKLDKINQRFIKSQELGYSRLNKIQTWMKEEQRLYHRQRAEILQDGFAYPTGNEKLLTITVLAISSPLWLTIILIFNICQKIRGYYHHL
ncbi:hypothetical protein N7456_013617 [Penicillium angulare]|uniref:Uncharacterized protein n=1 Tax=Penicillium angulare TaxID=116970 RepID=A0A9W9EFK8_9EURO|nr:hypothetical protein N7456_013617 [Penicillium angulare]